MKTATKTVSVTVPNGAVSHWLHTVSTWRSGQEGRTVCGKRAHLTIDYIGLRTCAQCERELRQFEEKSHG